ncbi:MAG: DNA-directed RNA polymerase subunit omega [Ruminococcus sp.]|jgi:DNA-directed RNA polymerase subunit omega|nr:DNA-directed RNA polymerase subunit omega [Ruminococcus sp.]
MKKVNVDELFEGKASRYALVIGVAKRARQITQDFVDQEIITDEKSVLLAIDEIKDHKINILEPEDEDL